MSLTDQHDLPSDSDDSDADFKPSDGESLSEEDSDGSVEEPTLENEEEQITSRGKRKKKQLKRSKKLKKKPTEEIEEDKEETEEVKKLSAEEEKKKADALWSDFMKDCAPPPKKTTEVAETNGSTKESKTLPTKSPVVEKENKAVVKEIFEFAGEKIEVEKVVPVQSSTSTRGRGGSGGTRGRGRGGGGGGGLASLVGQLGKKNKLSTLEKSKLDWDRFKKDEGITEEIQTFNKGKSGYLDKQDFLQRTDLRQFEIEKQLRTTSRSNR